MHASRSSIFALAATVAACSGSLAEPPSTGAAADVPPTAAIPTAPPASASSATDAGAPTLPTARTSGCGSDTSPGDTDFTVASRGKDRTVHVHVPKSYASNTPTAVVLNFHGHTSTATEEILLTGMNAKADAAGFVAVHPEGIAKSWNAGACCGDAVTDRVDDVGFVEDMLDLLQARFCIDPRRVFATGMSNGGFLSHRLACELGARIAAIAPVAGVLGISHCTPTRAVPVLSFHGTADTLVPYEGRADYGYTSVPDTFAGWAKRDACTGNPKVTYENGDTKCMTYESCRDGATVGLCTVNGGGHTWPGGIPVPWFGHTTSDIRATDAMWEFFAAHPLP